MSLFKLSLIAAALFLATASARAEDEQSGASVHFQLEVKKAMADSMEKQADSLEAQASQLEDRLDTIQEGREDLKDDLEDQIEDMHEAIADLKDKLDDAREEVQEKVEEMKEVADDALEEKEEALEEERHTGSFILALEYSHLDIDPLKNLARHDRSLVGKPFDFSNNQMLMFGLMGYYNLENNVRVGNGLFAGYKLFQSGEYTGTRYDSIGDFIDTVDSIVTLRVIPAYIGFICEKAFVYNPVNFFAGIMLGGSMSIVVKEEQQAAYASSFIHDDDDDDGDDESRFSVALAPAVAWDVHGGVAVRLSERLHLGIDGVVRFAYAYEGYGAGFGDFVSVSPGVRLRLTFGKAG